ncbi:MAG: 1-acyl-sn-glycerol-3-phosphate acyltransferase [Lachnospiraceae bacterium]|nr:1-acyl-sn-glycerol-3-phosphate acyltransferase [Lachnospiraceae bacterium]
MIRMLAALIFVIIFLLVSLILIPVGLLIGRINKKAGDWYAQAIVAWAFKVVGFIAGAKVTETGREKLPRDEAVLYVANHRSIFDIVLLDARIPAPTAIVAKKEMKKVPILSWWMILKHCKFLDREDLKQNLQIILECIEDAKNGQTILIYPEGTRSKSESELDIAPFKEGSMKIALKSGIKVVPVALHGTRDLLEKQFPRIRPGKVTISYGDPIDPKALDKEQQKHLGELCREKILEMLDPDN